MPRFEAAPKPKVETEKEDDEAIKVVDKRAVKGAEGLKRIEEEIKAEREKKRFDSMTPEQREEWEYGRDRERGFTVRDKRGVASIEDYKVAAPPSEKETPAVLPPPEKPAPLEEPEPTAHATLPEPVPKSLREQARDIGREANELRTSISKLREEITKTEKLREMKFGGMKDKIITLESSDLKQRLSKLFEDLERNLLGLSRIETVPFVRDELLKQAAEARKKISNLPSESAKKPKRNLWKFFGF